MISPLAALVLTGPVAFAAVGILGVRRGSSQLSRVQRGGAAAAWAGLVVALGAAGAVALIGPVTTPLVGHQGLGVSVRLDALSTIMVVMVSLLAVVIVRFANRYLEGDERHGQFLGRLAITIAAVELLVVAGNLVLLVAAWIATSLALHRLLVFYPDRPRAVAAARKKFVAARLGDVFLIAGVALAWRGAGSGELGALFEAAPAAMTQRWGTGALELAALCFAGAAILKSAQFPTHGWLVEVMETPTPVSALLHAGILNAGVFLMIRMAFLMDGADLANALLILVGGVTAVIASVSLLTQPSVKVALGYSSAAHMGFMLMVCGIGVYAAALLHLVAHSFYKAHAFLSSGGVVAEARAAKVVLPRRLGSPARLLAGLGIALAVYLPLAWVWGVDLLGEPVLLAIGAVLVMGTTQLMAPAVDSGARGDVVVRTAVLAGSVTLAFFALEAGMHHLLHHTVPEGTGREVAHLLLVATVITVFARVVALQMVEPGRGTSVRRRRLAMHLRHGLYANAALDRLVGAWRRPATGGAGR